MVEITGKILGEVVGDSDEVRQALAERKIAGFFGQRDPFDDHLSTIGKVHSFWQADSIVRNGSGDGHDLKFRRLWCSTQGRIEAKGAPFGVRKGRSRITASPHGIGRGMGGWRMADRRSEGLKVGGRRGRVEELKRFYRKGAKGAKGAKGRKAGVVEEVPSDQ